MKIYIDDKCKCHVTDTGGIYTEIEAPEQFEGKCQTYIEGYRVRPEGHSYTREDGRAFGPEGSSVSPWRDLNLLCEFQAQYEAQLAETEAVKAELADADAALAELGVTIDG